MGTPSTRATLRLPNSLWPSLHGLATGGPWPPESDVSADAFVETCAWHGLLPLLFTAEDLPEAVARATTRHRAQQRLFEQRGVLFRRAVDSAGALLEGERFAFLKGVDYAERLYGDLALRPMQDVDVLVPASRYEAVCRRLEQAGLQPLFPGTPSTHAGTYHERAFALDVFLLEVHQAFVQGPRHTVDYDALWERTDGPAGPGRRRLSDVDVLAHHALALGADQFQARMIRFVDLWLLVHLRPGIAEAAAQRAREWRAGRAFYGALRQACRLFEGLETEEVRRAMARALGVFEQRLLDRFVLPDPREAMRRRLPARPLQLFRKLALLDGAGRCAAFLAYQARAEIAGRWVRWRARRQRSEP